jgi:hypothetical protein
MQDQCQKRFLPLTAPLFFCLFLSVYFKESINVNIRSRFKTTVATVLGASMALQPMVSLAALHQMSFLKTDSPTLQTIDMTVNTDFDFDASPPVVVGGTTLDRAYITAALRVTAQSMFTMTEGRHRLGNVFVYRNNRFGNNVDTKFIALTKGRSNAPTSAWGKREGTANNFLVSAENDVESVATLGQVIAHENGHYLYGLYDEYREEGKALDPNDVGGASQIDTPLDTMMHNHRVYTGLSTPADNAPAAITTAQKRAMGASAWETLARDPSLDPLPGKNDGRVAFAAFAGFVPPNAAALTRPVTGWDAAFKVVFVPTPSNVDYYVIGRQVTADQLVGIKNAVIASLRRLTLGASTGVNISTFPGSVIVPTKIFDTEEKRTAAIAAVEALAVDATAGNVGVALEAMLTDVTALYAAKTYAQGDAISVHVFGNSQSAVSTAVRDRIRELRVALNANLLTADGVLPGSSAKRAVAQADLAKSAMRAKVASGGNLTLAQLAHVTGGHFTDARRASALTAGAVKAQRMSDGDDEIELAASHVDSLAANATFDVKTPVLEKTDGRLSFAAYWANEADNAKLRYQLTAPDGTRFVPSNPLVNQAFGVGGLVKYEFDAAANAATFEVAKNYIGRNGVWTSTVVASAAVNSPIEQEISADSSLRAEIEVIGDGTPNPILVVAVATNRAVQGAVATANFYGADGKLKLTKALTDDGKGGDRKPGDGIYSATLGGLLAAGQYDVEVTVTQGPSGAVFSTSGSTIKGVNAAPEPLGGAFVRGANTLLTMAPYLVSEYYVPSLKKYFITGREDEKADLARFPAVYSLTGMSFVAGPGGAPPVGTVPICRYYFSPPLANTHFYGTPPDCAAVATAFAGNASVKNDGIDFAVATPDAAGNCPTSSPVKVYRSFNNRAAQNDGNHRYTVSKARYDQMTAAGYSGEGAVFCAASATDAAQ